MAKKVWYAWRDALGNSGVCRTWDECKAESSGRPGDEHHGFATKEEAWAFAYPGMPMAAENTAASEFNAMQARHKETGSDMNLQIEDVCQLTETPTFQQIDFDRISYDEPTAEVNRFCTAYGFERLSKDQRRAVQAVDGKVLLFAVPGSGKTTVLIARIGYMVHARDIAAGKIVSLTFTKASATEMKERYQKRFPDDTTLPEFRTIHSFCFSKVIPLLRQVGYPVPHHLISDEREELKGAGKKKQNYETLIFSKINDGLKQISENRGEKTTVLLSGRKDHEALQTAITGIKNTMMVREQLEGKTLYIQSGQDLPIDRAYDVYMDLCKKYHCMDFDDILSFSLDGLRKHPEVLAQLQRQYHYWSIDEVQDNSPLQYELLQLLVGQHGNLFMVGDDDQSIYAFRGARPRLFQQFGMEPSVTVLTMGVNYRSAFGIVKSAEEFIGGNSSHQNKQMHAAQKDVGRIRFLYDLHTEKQQYAKIVETAKACQAHQKELAVLYRENISVLPVMFWLDKHGIPFFTAAKLTELLREPYISCILNLLQFAVKQNSYTLCAKVRSNLGIYPSNEITAKWKQMCDAAPWRKALDVLEEIQEKDYSSKTELLNRAVMSAPYDAICALIKELGIAPRSQSDRMQVYAILSISALYQSVSGMLSAICALKRKMNDDSEEDDNVEVLLPPSEYVQQKASSCAVTLSTMHSAKGLEFDYVMIIDFLEPPVIPYRPSQLTFDDPEEPRRLFYVAITRAKCALDILTVQSYHGMPEASHHFIREYALICDRENALTEYTVSVPEAVDCSPIKVYGQYYGVRVGRKPGVYTTWDEAQAQTNQFPHQSVRKFSTWEEAAAFAYPDGIPDRVRPVDTSIFKQYLVTNPTLRSNWPQDIPLCLIKGILDLIKTDSLTSLDSAARNGLEINYLHSHSGAFDYGGEKALAYTVNYLPLNYYKIWTPLWKLLEKKQLPYQARVLELGAGPGTAGLAMLDFYSKLARANPQLRFSVDYTAVEREKTFQWIWEHLMKVITLKMPANLQINKRLICADAFSFIKQMPTAAYDIVFESNMLNQDEAVSGAALSAISEGSARSLTEHGCVILIEPGKREQIQMLKEAISGNDLKLIFGPDIASVDITNNTLAKQCMDIGIRRKKIEEHWYSFAVAERKAL